MGKDIKIFKYKSADIEVHYDFKRCIHAAECVKGLPQVFDVNQKPWIKPENASAGEILKVIEKCPSGALKYKRLDKPEQETLDYEAEIKVVKNGPMYVFGDVTLLDSAGNEITREGRIALCRCGASKNKPFCDNTHKEINFHD